MQYNVDITDCNLACQFLAQFGIDVLCLKDEENVHTDIGNMFVTFFDNLELAATSKNNPKVHSAYYDFLEQMNGSVDFKPKECEQNFTYITGSQSVGKYVNISYTPYSQKYIDHYLSESFQGKVIYFNEQMDDGLVCYDDGNIRTVKSISRDGCSYFGTSRGYDYSLFEVVSA
jgi:thiaminase